MRRLVELCGTSLFVFHGCGRVAELVARPTQCGNQSRKGSLTKKSAVRQSQRARKKSNDRHGAWSRATNHRIKRAAPRRAGGFLVAFVLAAFRRRRDYTLCVVSTDLHFGETMFRFDTRQF